MNIIHKLTFIHLKKNRKQTLVTLIGVILSVTMITAVATSTSSFLDLLQRRAIRTDGNWHVLYHDVPVENLELITQDKNTKTSFLSQGIGHALLEGGQNSAKPYLHVMAFNEESTTAFPIHLIEGRLPENSQELIISKEVESLGGVSYNIGDTITLEVGQRVLDEDGSLITQDTWVYDIFPEHLIETKPYTFTIVGFMTEPRYASSWGPHFTVITSLDDTLYQTLDKFDISVQLNHLTPSLYNDATKLGEEAKVSKNINETPYVSFNKELLRYSGITGNDEINGMIYSLALFFMIVIMIASISVIYNAFSISAAKRLKHLGMLASVGATKAQKRSALLFEGFIIGLIAIPIGLFFGTVGMGITFHFISPIFQDRANLGVPLLLVISPASITVSIIFSSLTIFFSAWIPARRAAKVSPMMAIRQNKEIKLTSKSIKTSRFIHKYFGIEGDLALKNIKRQKRRYRSTIFSLVLSLSLFLTTASFLQQLKASYELTQNEANYDLSIHGDSPNYGYYIGKAGSPILIDQILQLDLVNDYNISQSVYIPINLSFEHLTSDYINYLEQDEGYRATNNFSLQLIGIRDELFMDLVPNSEILSHSSMEIPVLILNETPSYIDQKYSLFNVFNSTHDLSDAFSLNDSRFDDYTLNVLGVADTPPMGVDPHASNSISVITKLSTVESIFNSIENLAHSNLSFYMTTDDPMALEAEIFNLYSDEGIATLQINNFERERQSSLQITFIISVFSYGFITLITLICLVNVFNTITTSMLLRTRELAMIQSMGMDPQSFKKMIRFESFFYGMKALLYGLPISFVLIFFIRYLLSSNFMTPLMIPWPAVGVAIFGIFIFVGLSMMYSMAQIKKLNLIDALKQENI